MIGNPIDVTYVEGRSAISSCMEMSIGETLEVISSLKLPVVRTCHIGNVTPNNFGWLALVGNTYLGQMDHTLYGVDDIYFPWAVLGDRGRIEACYDHRGQPVPELYGQHANALLGSVPRKYRSLFSFGIFAEDRGEDLISRHCRTTAELGRRLNGSVSCSRSAEVLSLKPLLSELIRHFARRQLLHILFNKWVRTTRSGYVAMLKLQRIEYSAPSGLLFFTTDSAISFEGTIDELIERFFLGMEQVTARLVTGRRLSPLGYPWITTVFNFVLNAVKEHHADREQETFWHASATTNHLYIHQDWFRRDFTVLVEELERSGDLPAGAVHRIIPTLCCQLFSSAPESQEILDSLVAAWRGWLSRSGETAASYVSALARTTQPVALISELVRALPSPVLVELMDCLERFNAVDPHCLPIAYTPRPDSPTYNKYGISQRHLSDRRLCFPAGFTGMKWGEADLLVKVLAQLVADRSE
jgi:hypothetical protein